MAEKLAEAFSNWINGKEPIPAYLKVARTVMLSKTDSQYPPEGDVRVIAILPALTKLYEVFLQRELVNNIELHKPLHSNQRGFVAGGSCLKNIADLLSFTHKAKDRMKQQIAQKIPFKIRPKTYLLFIDLKKDFDTVDRGKLLTTMKGNGFNPTLIRAYSQFCDQMKL